MESLILEYSFEWQTIPGCQLTDGFTINWDANLFEPAENHYFYAVSEFKDAAGDYHQIDYITKPGLLREGGIGWMLNINSATSDAVATIQNRPFGGGGIFLIAKKRIFSTANHALIENERSTEYMDIYFDYAHQKIGVTFTEGNYDYMAGFARYQFEYD